MPNITRQEATFISKEVGLLDAIVFATDLGNIFITVFYPQGSYLLGRKDFYPIECSTFYSVIRRAIYDRSGA